MAGYTPLKLYFDEQLAMLLAAKIQAVYPNFPADTFVTYVADRVAPLELKARVAVLSSALRDALPSAYEEALKILLAILGPENPSETGMFTEGYWLMPVARFVEEYGQDHFEASMAAIYEITKRNTGEYAVRPFIQRYPAQSLAIIYLTHPGIFDLKK